MFRPGALIKVLVILHLFSLLLGVVLLFRNAVFSGSFQISHQVLVTFSNTTNTAWGSAPGKTIKTTRNQSCFFSSSSSFLCFWWNNGCLLYLSHSSVSSAGQLLSWQQGSEPELGSLLGRRRPGQPLQTAAGIRPLVAPPDWPLHNPHLNPVCRCFVFYFVFYSNLTLTLRTLLSICRTGPDTVVLNPSEPSKEKEKQGFFRAIKKKKKKSQMVTCMCFFFFPPVLFF